MQVGDIVTLTGRIVKVAEDGNPMNNLVVFEHHADKTDRFIEYWFNDVFLTKDEDRLAKLKNEFKKMFADEVYGIDPGQPVFRFRENHETLAEDVFRWIMEKLYE